MNSGNATHDAKRRIRRCAVATVSVLALAFSSSPLALADPDPVDELISKMEEISRDAEAKTELVKQLEVDLEAKEKDIEVLNANVDEARARAEQSREAVVMYQGDVNKIAQVKYRGATIDPITNVISAENPQNAIDRAAYISALERRTENTVAQLHDAARANADALNDAASAVAEAEYQAAELRKRREDLEKQQEELKARTEEIKQAVDALSPQDRQRWVEKNGPADYTLAGLVGANPQGMSALEAGMTKIGSPYGWGATGPNVFDCSGLVVWSYAQQGISVPRTSQAQMSGGIPVGRDQLQPGDVVGFYPGATHVGIYAGNGMILHASDYGIPVQVVPMDSMPFYGARRY